MHHDLRVGGATQTPHYIKELYDEHAHDLRFLEDGWLQSLYAGMISPRVNSIHHQGVKRLGRALTVEAWSSDGVIECIRREDHPFLVGVQWHPEFHDQRFPELLPSSLLLEAFMEAACARKD